MLVRHGRPPAAAAVGLERVAYRPLRKRGAKPLIFLITAIGMSFVLQEIRALRAAEVRRPRRHQRAAADQAGRSEGAVHDLRRAGHQHHDRHHRVRGGARARHRDPHQPHQVRPRHPGGRPGPEHRDADGRLAGAGHHADLPHRRRARRRRGDCCTRSRSRRASSTPAASSSASRRSAPRCSAASATCAVRCSAA